MAAAEQQDADPGPAPKRRRRVPTAIIVPVVVAALSAWLLPAITRQWDDRQKEHELKAAIIDDMTSATARALVAGDAIWSTRSDPKDRRLRGRRLTGQQLVRAGDGWTLASLKIEARLRTYFPDEVVAGWQVYTWAIDRFIDAHRVSAGAALGDVITRDARLDSHVADATALLLVFGPNAVPPHPDFTGDSPVENAEVGRLESMLHHDIARYTHQLQADQLHALYTWRVLEKYLLRFQQAVDHQIVSAHAAGYSTTTGDLIKDLIP